MNKINIKVYAARFKKQESQIQELEKNFDSSRKAMFTRAINKVCALNDNETCNWFEAGRLPDKFSDGENNKYICIQATLDAEIYEKFEKLKRSICRHLNYQKISNNDALSLILQAYIECLKNEKFQIQKTEHQNTQENDLTITEMYFIFSKMVVDEATELKDIVKILKDYKQRRL